MNSRITDLHKTYTSLAKNNPDLLSRIDEAEIAESVYNSNAIENSSLTLSQTEQILLEQETGKNTSLRDIFEAKNLSVVMDYLKTNKHSPLTTDLIFKLHEIFIGNIDPSIAGRFRNQNEFVRVGNFIATPPIHVASKIATLLEEYKNELNTDFLEKITRFHLEFELIHPFVDGNGRIGRTIINFQLAQLNFPQITIRTKDKNSYHLAFVAYQNNKNLKKMQKIIYLAILESLNKRIAYLKNLNIIRLSEYAKNRQIPGRSLLNQAKRQTIPAFRERGVWKIGVEN